LWADAQRHFQVASYLDDSDAVTPAIQFNGARWGRILFCGPGELAEDLTANVRNTNYQKKVMAGDLRGLQEA
jgi:hypothetical protein